MERKLQERMVGAGVLILALVLIGPLVLDGGPSDKREPVTAPGQRPEELRTQTFRLGSSELPQAASGSSASVPRKPSPGAAGASAPAAPAQLAAQPTDASTQPEPAPAPDEPPPAVVSKLEPAAELPAPPPPPKAEPVMPKPTTAGGDFLVQVGTFSQKDNADRLASSLKGKGYEAFVTAHSGGGKTLYRVRVGPAGSRAEAGRIAAQLAAAGQGGQVVAR